MYGSSHTQPDQPNTINFLSRTDIGNDLNKLGRVGMGLSFPKASSLPFLSKAIGRFSRSRIR